MMDINLYKYSINWLVVSTPLKNISQLRPLFPIYGKSEKRLQTTNELGFEFRKHGY
jgi:hypothetical protein